MRHCAFSSLFPNYSSYHDSTRDFKLLIQSVFLMRVLVEYLFTVPSQINALISVTVRKKKKKTLSLTVMW